MDLSSVTMAFIGATAAKVQMAAAATMMKMNADADRSVAQLIDAAQNNLDRLANVVAGVGGSLDISV
ncbi:MAG TPA: hypothetical protein VHA55_05640 [Pseudorhodoplanes sp.]|jgi:hypothetical protein|nr:hypothetical protein [Pseudorhodoplanes sp.]